MGRRERMKSSKYRWMNRQLFKSKYNNRRSFKKNRMKRLGISDTIISSATTIVNSITLSS
jgi:hypothetical protein